MRKYLLYLKVIDTYERINNFFLDYFGKGESIEALKENLWEYRKEIYANGDSDSIFYVDILVAVIIVACIILHGDFCRIVQAFHTRSGNHIYKVESL